MALSKVFFACDYMKNIQEKLKINKDISSFAEEGYVLVSLPDQSSVKSVRRRLNDKLSEIMGQKFNLEDYHQYIQNDDQHIEIHLEMLMFLHETELYLKVLAENKTVLVSLIGPDIDVQVCPHLRIARPGKPQDNIGFHCDIDYGNTSHEMSCITALTDLNEAGAVKVLPASHARPRMQTVAVVNDKAPKGSKLHRLGVPYSYKRIVDEGYKENMVPVPMKIGQALCFDLGVIHGQEVNNSSDTRWSIDVRLKNILAPTNTREGYYKSFSKSPLTEAAEKYLENNKNS